MQIQLEGISTLDNDIEYVNFISLAIKLADPESVVTFRKSIDKISVTISPSIKDFRQDIIETVLEANRRLETIIRFSKSLALQKNISFILEIPE